ncbi:MAG: hypothetical protein RLZZ244_3066 [Verrucomicrobiota bacterium]|jgi:hypothetical protein
MEPRGSYKGTHSAVFEIGSRLVGSTGRDLATPAKPSLEFGCEEEAFSRLESVFESAGLHEVEVRLPAPVTGKRRANLTAAAKRAAKYREASFGGQGFVGESGRRLPERGWRTSVGI